MSNKVLNYNCFNMLKSNNGKVFLEDIAFVDLMRNLKNNIEGILDLGFLEDCKKAIITSLNLNDSENILINEENISEYTSNKDVIEIVKFLSSHAICIIVEPNKNMYFDLDYELISRYIGKSLTRNSIYALVLHEKVQKFAVVDTQGAFNEKTKSFKEDVISDCDFQKNEVIFPYCCEALSSLELSITIYKR